MSNNRRFEFTGEAILTKAIEAGPYIVILTAFIVSLLAMLALILVDVVFGEITTGHVLALADFEWTSWFVSLATTGAMVATFGLFLKGLKDKWASGAVGFLLLMGIGIQGADFWSDMMSVDILRFGQIIYPKEVLTSAEVTTHYVFRGLIGTLSLFGEPMAAAAIVVFPELEKFLRDLLKFANRASSTQPRPGPHRPASTQPSYKPPVSTQVRPIVRPQAPTSFRPQPGAQSNTRPVYPAPTYHPVTSHRESDG